MQPYTQPQAISGLYKKDILGPVLTYIPMQISTLIHTGARNLESRVWEERRQREKNTHITRLLHAQRNTNIKAVTGNQCFAKAPEDLPRKAGKSESLKRETSFEVNREPLFMILFYPLMEEVRREVRRRGLCRTSGLASASKSLCSAQTVIDQLLSDQHWSLFGCCVESGPLGSATFLLVE